MIDRSQAESSRSFGTGSYGYSSVPYTNPDNVPELSAEQVKAAYEQALAEDQAAKDRAENQLDGDAFISAHPEIKDTVPNAKLFVHEMDRMFGPGRHPISHFEAAYTSLRASNFLALDQTVLAAQQKQEAKARYAAERERIATTAFDESVAETLPLEEIRRRAEQAHADNMRKIAEEGGW